MKYVVVLPQLGTPGEEWVPRPGISTEALVAGGFLRPVEDVGNDATPDRTRRKVTRKERT